MTFFCSGSPRLSHVVYCLRPSFVLTHSSACPLHLFFLTHPFSQSRSPATPLAPSSLFHSFTSGPAAPRPPPLPCNLIAALVPHSRSHPWNLLCGKVQKITPFLRFRLAMFRFLILNHHGASSFLFICLPRQKLDEGAFNPPFSSST